MGQRVSLIVPAYNAADVLTTALASVAAQTRPPDEVIVVDDGSTDGTAEVASRWESMLPLRVLRFEENIGAGLGAGAARDEGIRESSGDVIALLDADDMLLPSHLEVMLDLHARAGGLVTANHLVWVPGSAISASPISEMVPVPEPHLQRRVLITENFVFIASVFDRELYDRAGGFRSIRCEDWDLWIRMVEQGATVSMPGPVTALYRASTTSVSAGDRLLIGDIALLTELLDRVDDDERPLVESALSRRRARQHYLAGIQAFEAGRRLEARRLWLRSLIADHSLRRDNSRLSGPVALRSMACLVAPGTMLARRAARQRSAQAMVGNSG